MDRYNEQRFKNLNVDNFITARDKLVLLFYLYLNDREKYLRKSTELIEQIFLYYKGDFDCSLWYGIGSINIMLQSFDEYKELNNIFENIILLKITNTINEYKKNFNYQFMDLFSGFTGMIQSILNSNNRLIQNSLKKHINDISTIIIENKDNLNKLFFVSSELIKDNKKKLNYKNGYFDFTFAHGAICYLQILYKCYKKFKMKNTYYAIKILFIYIHDAIYNNKKNDFDLREKKYIFMGYKNSKTYSWCSGEISLLLVLINVNDYFGFINKNSLYDKMISLIQNYNLTTYSSNQFVCHGIHGTMLVLYVLSENKFFNEICKNKIEDLKLYENSNKLNEFENKKNSYCILTGITSTFLSKQILQGKNRLYLKFLLLD